MNFLGIFLKVFWTKNARKLLILTKIREKMLYIFFSSFNTKNVTKMLEKMSRTHRKRFRNFCEEIWTGKGANSKITARNMQDRGCV
jgi:hypothetical protein